MSDKNKDLPLTLKVITPEGIFPEIPCSSIILTVKDNEKGKGGGAYGIKRGHTNAIIATDKGKITAKAGESTVFCEIFSESFATVENNTVILTANSVNK